MSKCKLFGHGKLVQYGYHFTDSVSGKKVYKGTCKCGISQQKTNPNSWFGFRVILGER